MIPAAMMQQAWSCWILYSDLSRLAAGVLGGDRDCHFLVWTDTSWRTAKYNLAGCLWVVVSSRGMVRLGNFEFVSRFYKAVCSGQLCSRQAAAAALFLQLRLSLFLV